MQQLDHTPQVIRLRKEIIRLMSQLNEYERKIVQIQQKLSSSRLKKSSHASRITEQKIMDRICSHIYSSQFGHDIDNKIQHLQQQNTLLKKQLRRIQRINIVMHKKMQIQKNFFENLIQQLKNERRSEDDVKYMEYFQFLSQIEEQIRDLKNQRQHQQRQVRNLQKKINNLGNSRKLRKNDEHKANSWRNRGLQLQMKAKQKGSLTNLYKKDFIQETDQTFKHQSRNQRAQSPYFKNHLSQIPKRSRFFQSDNQMVNKNEYFYPQDQKKLNNDYSSSKFHTNQQNTHEKLDDPQNNKTNKEEQQLKTSGFFKQPDFQQVQKDEREQQQQKTQIFKNVNIKFRKNIKSRH